MPELPDVQIFKQYLDSTSLHHKVNRVEVAEKDILENIKPTQFKKRLNGSALESTRRYGKYLFAALDSGGWLALHFGMTGFLKYFKDEHDSPGHTRVRIDFANGYHLAFDCQRKLGHAGLIDDIDSYIEEKKLGPDALDPDLEYEYFKETVSKSRGAIKSALMNQNFLAGIGNVYSDEILFQSRVHPASVARNLPEDAVKTLFENRERVLKAAIKFRANPERFPRSYLLPRRGEDEKCPRCKGLIKTAKVSGRTASFCPKCQKKKS